MRSVVFVAFAAGATLACSSPQPSADAALDGNAPCDPPCHAGSVCMNGGCYSNPDALAGVDVQPGDTSTGLDATDAGTPPDAVDAGDVATMDAVDVGVGGDAAADAGDPLLDASYPSPMFRVAYQPTCTGLPCDMAIRDHTDPASHPTCAAAGGVLSFTVPACLASELGTGSCGQTLSGTIPASDAGATVLTLSFGSGGSAHHDATRVVVAAGPVIHGTSDTQSFGVQFFVPATPALEGATGVPGLTPDPTLGYLRLLGCPAP